jgi:hypothetical protein
MGKRSGTSASGFGGKGGGKSELPRDAGKRSIPGFLGREKVRTVEARTGYCKGETRFGPGGKGRVIPMKTGSSG